MDEPADKLDRIIAETVRARLDREQDYRARALKIYPWVCGRCSREFSHKTLNQLTVHHRDHNHQNNPPDGSNWELLCIYCHENEHARMGDALEATLQPKSVEPAKHQPFADLQERLKRR